MFPLALTRPTLTLPVPLGVSTMLALAAVVWISSCAESSMAPEISKLPAVTLPVLTSKLPPVTAPVTDTELKVPTDVMLGCAAVVTVSAVVAEPAVVA